MFGFFAKPPWTADQVPDLHGRVAIVTGANSGIGYITALELVRHGAKTYLACRNAARAKSAIDKIKAIVPDSDPQFLELDITSLNSAHSAAQQFLRVEKRLDILVNNAGVAMVSNQLSEDGIQIHACNATGHFAFTIPLLNLLEKTSEEPSSHVRIVNVSSDAHYWVWRTPDFSSIKSVNEHSFGTMDRYGLSKLMNILFNNELQRRLSHTKIICTSVHPGAVNTNLATASWMEYYPISKVFDWLKSWVLLTPEDGAINLLYAATDLEVEAKDLRSCYLRPFVKVSKTSKFAKDPDGTLGNQFWNLCEALVKEKVKAP